MQVSSFLYSVIKSFSAFFSLSKTSELCFINKPAQTKLVTTQNNHQGMVYYERTLYIQISNVQSKTQEATNVDI